MFIQFLVDAFKFRVDGASFVHPFVSLLSTVLSVVLVLLVPDLQPFVCILAPVLLLSMSKVSTEHIEHRGIAISDVERADNYNLSAAHVPFLVNTVREAALKHWSWVKSLDQRTYGYAANAGISHVSRSAGRQTGQASIGFYAMDELIGSVGGASVYRENMVFVDLCAGRGGFTQYHTVHNPYKSSAIHHLYSYWDDSPSGPGKHESLKISEDRRIHTHVGDYRSFGPVPCDFLMYDGGDARPGKGFEKEAELNAENASGLLPWFHRSPKCVFIIQIRDPWHPAFIQLCRAIQSVTGRGKLIRLPSTKNTNPKMYFVSGTRVAPPMMAEQIMTSYRRAYQHGCVGVQSRGKYSFFDVSTKSFHVHRNYPDFAPLNHYNMPDCVPELPEISGIDDCVRKYPGASMEVTSQTTRFLHEVARRHDNARTDNCAHNGINHTLMSAGSGLQHVYPRSELMKPTNITPKATFETVMRKVDVSPVEDHTHHDRLFECYRAISDYLKLSGEKLNRFSFDQVSQYANRRSAVGYSPFLSEYANMGTYLDKGSWQSDVGNFIRGLLTDRPIDAVFNSVGKKEKKIYKGKGSAHGSRLIWFLNAPGRLAELQILGDINRVVKRLPFSVSGLPGYEYGTIIDAKTLPNSHFVAEDIAGWDTRVSVGTLRLEAWFLQSLADSPQHAQEIHQLYRLYSHKRVCISRRDKPDPYNPETNMKSIYALQGQRGSGEVITYAMNTITNGAFSLAKYTYALGMAVGEVHDFVIDLLKKQASRLDERLTLGCSDVNPEMDMVVSGDDIVVFSDIARATAFSDAFTFNNDTGMIRKDINSECPSTVYSEIEDVEFCSHTYVLTQFALNDGQTVTRRMPYRDPAEIIGKMRWMLSTPRDMCVTQAYCRATAFQNLSMYPHIRDVVFLCRAILSCTRSDVSLQGMAESVRYTDTPWLTASDAVDVLNKCLLQGLRFAAPLDQKGWTSTGFTGIRADSVRTSSFLSPVQRRRRARWKRSLATQAAAMRAYIRIQSKVSDSVFDSYLHDDVAILGAENDFSYCSDLESLSHAVSLINNGGSGVKILDPCCQFDSKCVW